MAKHAITPTIEEIEAEVLAVRERIADWKPPSREQWADLSSPHWVNARVAFLTMLQSPEKAREMAESFNEMNADEGETALEATVNGLVTSVRPRTIAPRNDILERDGIARPGDKLDAHLVSHRSILCAASVPRWIAMKSAKTTWRLRTTS